MVDIHEGKNDSEKEEGGKEENVRDTRDGKEKLKQVHNKKMKHCLHPRGHHDRQQARVDNEEERKNIDKRGDNNKEEGEELFREGQEEGEEKEGIEEVVVKTCA